MDTAPVMYILINSSLKLSVGQCAVQTAHVVHLIVEENIRTAYESYPVPPSYLTYLKWCRCPTTIVKKASEEKLIELLKMDEVKCIYDDIYNKQTKQKSLQLTAIGFYPSEILTTIMNDYELL